MSKIKNLYIVDNSYKTPINTAIDLSIAMSNVRKIVGDNAKALIYKDELDDYLINSICKQVRVKCLNGTSYSPNSIVYNKNSLTKELIDTYYKLDNILYDNYTNNYVSISGIIGIDSNSSSNKWLPEDHSNMWLIILSHSKLSKSDLRVINNSDLNEFNLVVVTNSSTSEVLDKLSLDETIQVRSSYSLLNEFNIPHYPNLTRLTKSKVIRHNLNYWFNRKFVTGFNNVKDDYVDYISKHPDCVSYDEFTKKHNTITKLLTNKYSFNKIVIKNNKWCMEDLSYL